MDQEQQDFQQTDPEHVDLSFLDVTPTDPTSIPTDEGDQQAGQAHAARKKPDPITRMPSHLHESDRVKCRHAAITAAHLSLAHAPEVHYSQGPTRWDGINHHLIASKGQFPTSLDCSASVTWWLWNGLVLMFNEPDIVNGENWHAGYTGTMVGHGVVIPHPKNWLPGDYILYGNPTTEHTALVVGWDPRTKYHMVVSHGSEAGPYYLPWNYRTDFNSCRRVI